MIKIEHTFPVAPEKLFEDWLNSEAHSAMTGGGAEVSPMPNAEFTAWDGYIEGVNLELIIGQKILQTWRTAEFEESDEDSILEILLEADGDGTKMTLIHERLPEGTAEKYKSGWMEHYIEPMMVYYHGI